MANRYAVASGNWDLTNTAIWSETDGGAPGASVPGASDAVYISTVGITVTVQVDVTIANIVLSKGTLNTNGKTINTGAITDSGTLARSFVFGSSVINCTSFAINSITGYSVDAGTSCIKCSTGNFQGGTGKIYYDVELNGTTQQLVNAGTFNSVTRTGTPVKDCTFQLLADVTINTILTITGNSPSNRVLLFSSVVGTTRIITAASVSLKDVDFQDITGAGAATWTGTRLGDCKGNSGITFDTPKSVYWVGNGGDWSDATNHWSLEDNGSPGVNNYPLPQDSAIFNDHSITLVSQTITCDVPRIPGFDFTGCLNTPRLAHPVANTCYGNIVTGESVDSALQVITLSGRGTQRINIGTGYFYNSITIDSYGGSVVFDTNVNLFSGVITLIRGTLDDGDADVTAGAFSSSNSNVRSLIKGTGTWTLTSTGTVWDTATTTGLTFTDAGTTKINNATSTGKTFSGGNWQSWLYKNSLFTYGSISNYSYAIYDVPGGTLLTSGVVAGTNVKISSVAGLSFIDIGGVLTGYVGKWLEVADPSARIISGWIDAAGTGETYLEKMNDTGFDSDVAWTKGIGWTVSGSKAIGSVASNQAISQVPGSISGELYKTSFTIVTYTGTAAQKIAVNASGVVGISRGSTGIYTQYLTCSSTNIFALVGTFGQGFVGTIDDFSMLKVLTPSETGVWISNGMVYNDVVFEGAGTGALTFIGDMKFNNLRNNARPKTFTFTSGSKQTFIGAGPSFNGTAGNLITLNASGADTYTFSKASGVVTVNYTSLAKSVAQGGALWEAGLTLGDVDGGGNVGWHWLKLLTSSIDAMIQKIDLTRTVSVDAFIQQANIEMSASLNAAIQEANLTGQLSVDAMLQTTWVMNAVVDALAQRTGIAKETIIDSLIQATYSQGTNLDAVIWEAGYRIVAHEVFGEPERNKIIVVQ